MKKAILTLFGAMLALCSYAEEYSDDIFNYDLNNETHTAAIVSYKPNTRLSVTVPSEITVYSTTYKVTSIKNNAFYASTDLWSVILPKTIKSIGNGAFSLCTNLKSITLPEGLDSIKSNTFSVCANLKEIKLPNTIRYIGNSAFLSCNLTEIKLPDSLRYVGIAAFSANPIDKIYIPKHVESIEPGAFSCNSLSSITIDPENKTYDSRDNCNAIVITNTNTLWKGIRTSTIPKTVTALGKLAYDGCYDLKELTIPSQIERMEVSNLWNLGGLESIKVDKNNKVFDSRNDCNAAIETKTNTLVRGCKNTIIPNTIKTIGKWAFYNTKCQKIELPNSVEVLDTSAFSGCYSEEIILPKSLKKISMDAFSNCSELTKLTLPNSITELAANAFYGTYKLTEITSYITNPEKFPLNTTWNEYMNAYNTLYVPYGTKEAYMNTQGWNVFKNIIEMPNDETTNISGIISDSAQKSLYNIAGQKVNGNCKGITIVKYSDGSTRKVIKK